VREVGREVPGWLVAVVVIVVLLIVGFAYWYFGRPNLTQEQQQLPPTHQPVPLPTTP
jgi:cytoskeletal protein RodZ